MQYQTFVRSEADRRRYWARSTVGWSRIASTEPNPGHRALAAMEAGGAIQGIITQNVDGLHHRAGSRRVVELHGSLEWVICLGCGSRQSRAVFHDRVRAENPDVIEGIRELMTAGGAEAAPDGDADLTSGMIERLRVPHCSACAGIIKPDVVFFGENVPTATVEQAWSLFAEGEVLVVAGSSLTVYSGRRFIYRAQKEGMPIVILNQGPTRADEMAATKVEGRLGELLPDLAEQLLG